MTEAASYQVDSLPLTGTRRIFVARRSGHSARVLIKTPRPGHAAPQEMALLRHEFNVLTRLKGAPVTEVVELLESPLAGMVMTATPGRPLDVLIRAGQCDLQRILDYAVAMARTLATVHEHGFVHRDIKPQHFFIDEEAARARLIDFGLAASPLHDGKLAVTADEILGTLAYLSPEQTGRTSLSLDQRSDLYSLGVTLYELCTGRRPFESQDPLELIHAHVAKRPAPPRQLRPELPQVLEDLVLRLLAKSPAERYQTAAGLAADLERMQAALRSADGISAFPLGRDDHDGRLRVPEKLYGRASQSKTLADQVQSVQRGARCITLVAGPPGVGKTALVAEVEQRIGRGVRFVSGKFDQYSRGVPYSALARACGELVRVYLASPPRELEAWKRRLLLALGDNARVIADVVPQLFAVLGEQPEVAPLPPNESQSRFERTLRRFMEASACQESPLVLFLDDLQWADAASLDALELILASESQKHLLLIGSYRDVDVDASHPLSLLLARLEHRVAVTRILLSDLSRDEVRELVVDALPQATQSREALADLLYEKTTGNPYFIGQFLQRLAAERFISFERGRGFDWNLDAISRMGASDNVVDLIVARLATLAPSTRELLKLAACFGHTFDLQTLSIIAELSPSATLQALAPALAGGFILPLSEEQRLLHELLSASADTKVDASYRFAHDRVQQASVATMDAGLRSRAHLRIGRLLLSAAGAAELDDERLFRITTQLNLGREHLQDPAERHLAARLNLRASRRARSAAAHASAAQLAGLSVELLGATPFETDYATSLAAHELRAEALYLSHDEQGALDLIVAIEKHATSALDRVPARNLKATIITKQGRPQEATAISLQTAVSLGMQLPDPQDLAGLGPAIGEAFGSYQVALGSRPVASLAQLPAMADPIQLALISALAGAIPSAFQWNPSLMVLLVLRAVRLPLEHGTAPVSPFFYAQYGIVHHVITGDAERAHEFGELALSLARRPEHAGARGGVDFIYAEFLAPWVRPRQECAGHFRRGVSEGLDGGDRLHAGFCMAVGVAEGLYAGLPLADLAAEIPGYAKALRDQGDVLNHLLIDMVERSIDALQGKTQLSGSMDGDGFSEARFEAESPPPVKAHYGAIKGMLRFLFDDPAEARRITEEVAPPPGVVFKVEYVFYHGMACVELARSAPPQEAATLLEKARADLACFEPWVRTSRHNFGALSDLLRAELLAATGESGAAREAYDMALETATSAAAPHHLALVRERLGRFLLQAGHTRLAGECLATAVQHYDDWGATAKAERLRREFPLPASRDPFDHETTWGPNSARTSSSGGGLLDLTSAMRAVNAMASEIRFEPLLRRLLQIVVENAGATRGVLLLGEQFDLRLRASLDVQKGELRVDMNEPLVTSQALASSLVLYCARTLQPLVVESAVRDPRFAHDPFIEKQRSKSLACLPLLHQGGLVGVLYLENDTTTGAFLPTRVERLQFLAGHAAVSLQNARLYDELEASNQHLEQRVRERTLEVSARNQDMRRVLDNVKQGLLTVDLDGRLAPEHSRVVDEWLGTFEPGTKFEQYLARVDARAANHFRLSFAQLVEGVLPLEVLLVQFPTALTCGDRHLALSYQPISSEGEISALLVVIDDVTEATRLAREGAEQREIQTLCSHLVKDRGALLSFFEEGQTLIEGLLESRLVDEATRRHLHTLKGNAALFGFFTLAERCHAAEDAIEEGTFDAPHIEVVAQRFAALQTALDSIGGTNAGERVELPHTTLKALARELRAGLPSADAARALEHLLLEPVRPSLERLGRYACALAGRLGKPEPRLTIDDGGLLVERRRAAPLLSALVHLIRNAVDHGLEPRDELQASGKAAPSLGLSASVSDGQARFVIRDNGRGIDWERVRERARARGLPSGSLEELSRALFSAEFSTRESATTTSGRGIGLTAVQSEVTRLSGNLQVESEVGRGTTFRIDVPVAALGVAERP